MSNRRPFIRVVSESAPDEHLSTRGKGLVASFWDTMSGFIADLMENVPNVNAIDMLENNGNFAHNNKLYEHFRLPGHSHRNMRIFVLEEVFGDDNILKAREDYWIMKCNSVHRGLNTKRK